jgi:hypothetical protein
MNELDTTEKKVSCVAMLQKQRSHVLFVLSNARAGREPAFLTWYRADCKRAALKIPTLLSARHYQQHNVDITQGRWPRPAFRYLALYEISVDGAEAARELIERVNLLHNEQPDAEAPATWLYYPVGEKVGRIPDVQPSLLTIAFANGVPGSENEFREWYVTRHIRHALSIPALVSGQCFERTQFQTPGVQGASYAMITLYEQEGTPEAIIESFASLPPGSLDFPTLDLTPLRFAESVYRPL